MSLRDLRPYLLAILMTLPGKAQGQARQRSEEHTSELQSHA